MQVELRQLSSGNGHSAVFGGRSESVAFKRLMGELGNKDKALARFTDRGGIIDNLRTHQEEFVWGRNMHRFVWEVKGNKLVSPYGTIEQLTDPKENGGSTLQTLQSREKTLLSAKGDVQVAWISPGEKSSDYSFLYTWTRKAGADQVYGTAIRLELDSAERATFLEKLSGGNIKFAADKPLSNTDVLKTSITSYKPDLFITPYRLIETIEEIYSPLRRREKTEYLTKFSEEARSFSQRETEAEKVETDRQRRKLLELIKTEPNIAAAINIWRVAVEKGLALTRKMADRLRKATEQLPIKDRVQRLEGVSKTVVTDKNIKQELDGKSEVGRREEKIASKEADDAVSSTREVEIYRHSKVHKGDVSLEVKKRSRKDVSGTQSIFGKENSFSQPTKVVVKMVVGRGERISQVKSKMKKISVDQRLMRSARKDKRRIIQRKSSRSQRGLSREGRFSVKRARKEKYLISRRQSKLANKIGKEERVTVRTKEKKIVRRHFSPLGRGLLESRQGRSLRERKKLRCKEIILRRTRRKETMRTRERKQIETDQRLNREKRKRLIRLEKFPQERNFFPKNQKRRRKMEAVETFSRRVARFKKTIIPTIMINPLEKQISTFSKTTNYRPTKKLRRNSHRGIIFLYRQLSGSRFGSICL